MAEKNEFLCLISEEQEINIEILRAENETRTRDPNLGKVMLYQLSYFRMNKWRGGDSNSHVAIDTTPSK